MSERDLVLARIRAALGPSPAPVRVPREYRTTGEHATGSPAVLDLLTHRLVDYKAEVLRCSVDEIPAAVATALSSALGAPCGTLLVPAGLPEPWQAGWRSTDGQRVTTDPDPAGVPLTVQALDAVDAVLTGCAVAIAETGTIVLDGSPDQGRRAISLVPDLHLVVVHADQVVQTVPEGLARLRPDAVGPVRPFTLISGPSATSDIELERVEGVHGPRTLLVVLAG